MSIFHTRVYNELYMIKNSNGSPMINEKQSTKRQKSITWSTQTIVYFDPSRGKLFSSFSSDADDEAEDEVEYEQEDESEAEVEYEQEYEQEYELEYESDTTISDTDTVSDFIEKESIICTIS